MKNKVIHILSKHINWSNGGNLDDQFTIDELLEAMPEIFKIVCEEQKKICAESAEIKPDEYIGKLSVDECDFEIDKNSIINCETVKFE